MFCPHQSRQECDIIWNCSHCEWLGDRYGEFSLILFERTSLRIGRFADIRDPRGIIGHIHLDDGADGGLFILDFSLSVSRCLSSIFTANVPGASWRGILGMPFARWNRINLTSFIAYFWCRRRFHVDVTRKRNNPRFACEEGAQRFQRFIACSQPC